MNSMTSPKGSQQHSPIKDVRSKLAKATELESKYLSATSASSSLKNEANIQMLRTKLCEQFSDILLLDPTYSARKDISGRLWRSCFHGRVQELRDRITKEKIKLKKMQRSTKTLDVPYGPDEDAQKQQQALVDNLERILNTFLQESVVLYEYLIDQYQGKLLPNWNTQISQTQATPVHVTEQDTTEPTMDGVVPILHKFYIQLGDLLRYSSNYTSAEHAYLKAAKLAPGRGNPYNQLAVIGQIKDTQAPLPVIVLYWYCRSMLATEDPFPTATANLDRFFSLHSKEVAARDNPTDTTNPPASTAGLSREKARALKASTNRQFLQAFTEFHGYLYIATKSPAQDKIGEKTIQFHNMDSLLSQLDWLLAESAFSDALLNKMIVINASSLWNMLYAKHSVKEEYVMVALTWILEFGVHLSRSFVPILDKLLGKPISQGTNGGFITIRWFTPILFICEFISSLWLKNDRFKIIWESNNPLDPRDQECRMKCEESRVLFWSQIAQIANVLVSSHYFQSINWDTFRLTDDSTNALRPIDYEDMRGFKPFDTFVSIFPRNDVLSPQEAVSVLELDTALSQSHAPLSSQATGSSSNKTVRRGDTESEFSVKINRFYLFVLRHTSLELQLNSDGLFSVNRNKEDKEPIHGDVVHSENPLDLETSAKIDTFEDETATNMQVDDEDDAGDCVVYKTSALVTSHLVPVSADECTLNDKPTASLSSSNRLDSTVLLGDIRESTYLKPSDLVGFPAMDLTLAKGHFSTSLETTTKRSVRPPPGFLPLNNKEEDVGGGMALSSEGSSGFNVPGVNPIGLIGTNGYNTSNDGKSYNLNSLCNTNNPFFVPMPLLERENYRHPDPVGSELTSRSFTDSQDFSFHLFPFSEYTRPQSIESSSRFLQFFDSGRQTRSKGDDPNGSEFPLFTRNPFA